MKPRHRLKIPKEMVKLPVSTSVPQLYVHRLEELAKARGGISFAGYVRLVLMDHVDGKSNDVPDTP